MHSLTRKCIGPATNWPCLCTTLGLHLETLSHRGENGVQIPRTRLCLVGVMRSRPPQRLRFGLHVLVQQFFDHVIHHAYQSLFVVSPHRAPQHALVVVFSAKGKSSASGLPHFLGFPQHVFGHTSPQHRNLHTTLADTLRIPELRLTVFEASRASNILHLRQQSCRHVPVNSCQGENPGRHVERRFHVQAPPLNRFLLLVQQVHQNCEIT